MTTAKSGISKVGNNYYQSLTTSNADGSVGTTLFRVDAQGNNGVPIYDVDTAAGSTTLVKSFDTNATDEEKRLLSDPNSQLSQARAQQITSSNPFNDDQPTAAQQQTLAKASGGSGNTAPPESSGQPAATTGTSASLTQEQLGQQTQESIGRNTDAEKGDDLRYPIKNTYQGDYLCIEMRTYQKSGFQSEADTFTVTRMEDRKHTRLRTIYLPIQSGIVDSISVDWGNGDLNPITAQFANLAMGTMTEAAKGDLGAAAKNFAGGVFDVANKFLGSTGDLQKLAVNYFTERAVGQPGLLSRSIGGAINNNLELLFNGPTLRAFTFNFKLTPREPKEAAVIKEIIRVFKRGMSPALSESGLFLSAPNVFKIKYIYTGKGNKTEDHPYLNRIKVAALRDFSVNYTPDGNYMTYGAESDEGEGSMTQYDLSMTFGEIDPVYAQDYDETQGKTGMGW
jgi:hypothetical protein